MSAVFPSKFGCSSHNNPKESLTCNAGRAAAAAGQSGLMALYDSLFSLMDLQSAQVLVTSNDFTEPTFKKNLCATVEDLLSMSVVPVFNENDAISDRSSVSCCLHEAFSSVWSPSSWRMRS